ncbi:hypothetical protein EHP00_46 [Ecytonucleospora hepatopenaei]|uniref:Uncharacterized protein n=1 Tax=Ecytonucleospora hepatopenaei TaxID=646526 RepID=A0A1W0E5L7_9MICR|nr:hypothetical protein EHP00_46 [Ecytonucleospora hepatopenaei]
MSKNTFLFFTDKKEKDFDSINTFKHKFYAHKTLTTNNNIQKTTIFISEKRKNESFFYCATNEDVKEPKNLFQIKNNISYSMISPVAKKIDNQPGKKFKKSTQTNIMSFFKK